MKYFSKFLPKPGGFSRVVKENGIPVDYEQEVQLFLCTADIKTGDKVQFQLAPSTSKWKELKVIDVYKDDNEHTATLQDGESKIYTTPDKWCFKVIGPISPEATWVKEGDVFEEDEVRRGSYRPSVHNSTYLIVDCHDDLSYHEWEEDSRNIKSGWENCMLIKGPCGHYH